MQTVWLIKASSGVWSPINIMRMTFMPMVCFAYRIHTPTGIILFINLKSEPTLLFLSGVHANHMTYEACSEIDVIDHQLIPCEWHLRERFVLHVICTKWESLLCTQRACCAQFELSDISMINGSRISIVEMIFESLDTQFNNSDRAQYTCYAWVHNRTPNSYIH